MQKVDERQNSWNHNNSFASGLRSDSDSGTRTLGPHQRFHHINRNFSKVRSSAPIVKFYAFPLYLKKKRRRKKRKNIEKLPFPPGFPKTDDVLFACSGNCRTKVGCVTHELQIRNHGGHKTNVRTISPPPRLTSPEIISGCRIAEKDQKPAKIDIFNFPSF